ncbi:class I SAM-dependent methyltransferase [Kribbella endophytica]
MDAKTDELRSAHDALADWYAETLDGALERMPIERSVLDLFSELTVSSGIRSKRPGSDHARGGDPTAVVGDIGCGTGRLAPYLASRGLTPHGVDLSPRMIELARRDYPDFTFEVGDLRKLPFEDASLAGVVCWFSLIFLAPADRDPAFAELARVVRPGGYFVTGFKPGDGKVRRGGRAAGLGVEYDGYWLPADEMEARVTAAGFTTVYRGVRPADEDDPHTYVYLLARRRPLD